MPTVLVNPDSGLAESHDDPSLVQQKLDSGYHLPLHDENGNAFSAPFDEAKELVSSGKYRQPGPDELNTWMKVSKFQQPAEQAKSFIEGAARGIGGPLATGAELAMGVPAENIELRKHLNPGSAIAGEALSTVAATAATAGFFGEARAGMAAASLPGIIQKAGKAASDGIALEGTFGNIAKAATASAIEGGLYAAQNKITEGLIGDPNSFSEHILADVGVSSLLAGAAGGAIAAGMGPFSKLAKQVEKVSSFVKKAVPEGTEISEASAPQMMRRFKQGPIPGLPPSMDPNEPLFEHVPVPTAAPKSNEWGAKLEMPEFGAADIVSLIKNPYLYAASQISKMAAKVTLPKLAEAFGEQAPKVASILEAFKMGLNTVAKIEDKTAGLFGYNVFRASEKQESPFKLHDLYDDSNAIESDPGIFIKQMQKHTEPMAGDLPDTTIGLSKAAGNALNLIKGLRPNLQKTSFFDRTPQPTQGQIAKFNNIAHTINNPLSVLDHVKTGTLSQDHLNVMRQVYPSVFQNMQKETVKNLMRYQSENKSPLDYKMRLGLSKLLEQPLDSSLLSIGKNQMALGGMQQAQPAQHGPQNAKPSKSGISKMKSATREQTRAQQSVERKPA